MSKDKEAIEFFVEESKRNYLESRKAAIDFKVRNSSNMFEQPNKELRN